MRSMESSSLKLATLMEGYVSGTEDEEEDQNSARDFIAETAEVLQVKLVLDNLYIYIKCIYIYTYTPIYIYIYYLHYICAYIHMCPYLWIYIYIHMLYLSIYNIFIYIYKCIRTILVSNILIYIYDTNWLFYIYRSTNVKYTS